MVAYFFNIKHEESCDIFKNFLNMLINHKINEVKRGRKKHVLQCQGSVCCQDSVIRKPMQLQFST